MVVVGLLVAREVRLQIQDPGWAHGPDMVHSSAPGQPMLICAREGIPEIIVTQLVFVIPANGGEGLLRVIPGLVAARHNIGHLVLAGGVRHEIVGVGAGPIAGGIRQRDVSQDVLRDLAQAVAGDRHHRKQRPAALGVHA